SCRKELPRLCAELLANRDDGGIKLFVTWVGLRTRSQYRELFESGAYQAVNVTGSKRKHVCAIVRRHESQTVIAVAPVLVAGLLRHAAGACPMGEAVWGDTMLSMPSDLGGAYENLMTGQRLQSRPSGRRASLALSCALSAFPVALLRRLGG